MLRSRQILLVLLALGLAGRIHAGQVSVGFIGVFTGLGAAPNNNLVVVQNATGPAFDCTATTLGGPALSCDALSFINWTAQIDYTDSLNQTHTITDSGASIDPNNDAFGIPIDGSLVYADLTNPCCLNVITKVVFTAQLSSTTFTVCDPNTPCDSSHPLATSTFFNAQSPFTFTFIPGPSYSAGTDTTAGDAVDLVINDVIPGGGGGVPEPATVSLIACGIAAIVARRRIVVR